MCFDLVDVVLWTKPRLILLVGGMLMMNLPSVVVHDLDAWSPLVPRPHELALLQQQQTQQQLRNLPALGGGGDGSKRVRRRTPMTSERPAGPAHLRLEAALLQPGEEQHGQEQGLGRGLDQAAGTACVHTPRELSFEHRPYAHWRFPDPVIRQIDCDQGNRDCVVCPTCGESYMSTAQLAIHSRYCCTDDQISGWNASLACATCGESFASQAGLARHCRYENDANPQKPPHVPVQPPPKTASGGKKSVPRFGFGGGGGDVESVAPRHTAAAVLGMETGFLLDQSRDVEPAARADENPQGWAPTTSTTRTAAAAVAPNLAAQANSVVGDGSEPNSWHAEATGMPSCREHSQSIIGTLLAGMRVGRLAGSVWLIKLCRFLLCCCVAYDTSRHQPLPQAQAEAASWYGSAGEDGAGRREVVENWLRETNAEVIVLVEGIDSTTSYTVQARHSYPLAYLSPQTCLIDPIYFVWAGVHESIPFRT